MPSYAPRENLTREAVITATRTLIIDEGLEAVSLRRLGSLLGVTAPALYAYVQDKNDLLSAVATAEIERLMDRLAAAAEHGDGDGDTLSRVRAQFRAYVDFACENPTLFRTMFLHPPEVPHTTIASVRETPAMKMPLESIVEGIEQGLIKDLDPAFVALIMWTAAHGLAHVLLLGVPFDGELGEALTEQVLDVVLAGLRPDAATALTAPAIAQPRSSTRSADSP